MTVLLTTLMEPSDSDKFCCYPWLVCHDITSAMHCSLRLAPTMINHLTSTASNQTGIWGRSRNEPARVGILALFQNQVKLERWLFVTNLSSENNFADISTECSSRHQGESERSAK